MNKGRRFTLKKEKVVTLCLKKMKTIPDVWLDRNLYLRGLIEL